MLCEKFLSHVERRVFPGGCFFASAAAELDTRPGAVRERISEFQRGWTDLLVQHVREAQAAGQLRPEDPDQLVFELNGYLIMANMAFLLYDSNQPIERAREAVATRLSDGSDELRRSTGERHHCETLAQGTGLLLRSSSNSHAQFD